MSNRRKWVYTAIALMLCCLLLVGVAYARYQAQLQNTIQFQTGQLQMLALAKQEWTQSEDMYQLTFSVGEAAENCRIYLAASDGVTAPEKMQVILTFPEGESLQATAEPIYDNSILASLFGTGYAFRFLDAGGNEITFDLTTADYSLTVAGMDGAAEQASLLRLFVEQVPE